MSRETLRLCAVGDVFLGDTTIQIGRGVRSSIDRHGAAPFVAAMRGFFRKSDLVFGNLECVLSDYGRREWNLDSVEMRGRPEFAALLATSGINLVNVANNHIFQHGSIPFRETLDNLRRHGIEAIGEEAPAGGASRAVVIRKKGITVGFVGFSLHYEQYRPAEPCPYALRRDGESVVAEVVRLRRSFEGPLVCSLHWGHEFVDRPSAAQQRLARRLIEEGATIVLGHHPHVVQGIERYRQGLIAYSLGNFVFDFRIPELRETVALAVEVARNGVLSYQTIPVVINERFCPEPATDAVGQRIVERVVQLSSALAAGELPADGELAALSHRLYRRYRRQHIRSFLASIHRYHPFHSTRIIARFVMRKLGLLHDP